jgi:hypothetical protein
MLTYCCQRCFLNAQPPKYLCQEIYQFPNPIVIKVWVKKLNIITSVGKFSERRKSNQIFEHPFILLRSRSACTSR